MTCDHYIGRKINITHIPNRIQGSGSGSGLYLGNITFSTVGKTFSIDST